MNAVEIEEAISALAEQPFDAQEFPFAFLQAFGNKETTIKRLRSGATNKSDLGGVLQTNNIHLAVCAPGDATKTLAALKASPATVKAKAKFILATDGVDFEAEDIDSGETVACDYKDFPNRFGFFLPLAGITPVQQVRDSAFDIRATGRLKKLYVELLKDNPDWGAAERSHDMNHFMARLIFCFFAEDTDIFNGPNLFTATIEQMSARDASNTHQVISELFRAMNTRMQGRTSAKIRSWADTFPYVICPPTGTDVKQHADDLFHTPLDQAQINFENVGGETYICGNPPYLGSTWQSADQKADIRAVLRGRTTSSGFLDYVAGWFIKAADWLAKVPGVAAFVSTNSICQGQSVSILWPILFDAGCEIRFAYTSFKWSNLASNKAGVTVAIIGVGTPTSAPHRLYEHEEDGGVLVREGESITPYLTLGPRIIVEKRGKPISAIDVMEFGNKPSDGGHLLCQQEELALLGLDAAQRDKFIRRIYGSQDFINGGSRLCIWIENRHLSEAMSVDPLKARIEAVRKIRLASPDKGANALAKRAHQLKLMRIGTRSTIVVPSVSSERRPYLPAGLVDDRTTLTNLAFGLYDAPLWNMALVASRLHLVWIATVCGKLKNDFRYSNTLGWNTFPVPTLTDKNKADLTRSAEDILLAREAHFPATIADLYDPKSMPVDLRQAHDRNDEVLERTYIGRRFRNDTERLEKLFEMYAKMGSKGRAASAR